MSGRAEPAGTQHPRSASADSATSSAQQERREFHSYVWGFALALLLTLVPFALVHWAAFARPVVLAIIYSLALGQAVVHFRFFLHLGFHRKREDLQLVLFSALLLFLMVAGTLWIMGSLAMRMDMPPHP